MSNNLPPAESYPKSEQPLDVVAVGGLISATFARRIVRRIEKGNLIVDLGRAEAVLLRLLASAGVADRYEVRSGGIAPYARDGSLVSLDARFVLRDIGIHVPEGAGATGVVA